MKNHYFSAYRGLPKDVYALFAARLINSVGFFIMPLLTLILTQKLGMTKAAAGNLISLLVLTQAPCIILGGKLADSLGRKKVFVGGSLTGAFFYLLCAFGVSGSWMIACIILAADMVAVAVPSADAMLADLTTPEQRQSAFSLLYLGINIGMAVSPILGGLLFRNHLPLLFLLDAATTIASATIIILHVREKYCPDGTNGVADSPGCRKQSLLGTLKAAPVLTGFVLLLFLFDFCYSQWNFMLPAQCGDRFGGDGARFFSLLSSANAFTVILLTPLVTAAARRLRPLAAVSLGGLLYGCAYFVFSFGGNLALCFLAAELFTFGEICTTIQIGAFLANHTPGGCRGRVTAFTFFVRGSANCFGPLVMGHVLTALGYRISWVIIASVVLAGSAGMLLLNKKDADGTIA